MSYYRDHWEELYPEEEKEYEYNYFLGFLVSLFLMAMGAFFCSLLYDPEITWFPVLIDFLGDLL